MTSSETIFEDRTAGAALDVWRQARRLHYVTVTGSSMWPLIRAGDLLLVAYGDHGVGLGDVVVVYSEERLLVHRIVRITDEDGKQLFYTKGDTTSKSDPPSHEDQVMGRVLTVQRGERQLVLDEAPWPAIGRAIATVTPVLSRIYSLGRSLMHRLLHNTPASRSADHLAQVETDFD